jgi:hypothetical protein
MCIYDNLVFFIRPTIFSDVGSYMVVPPFTALLAVSSGKISCDNRPMPKKNNTEWEKQQSAQDSFFAEPAIPNLGPCLITTAINF